MTVYKNMKLDKLNEIDIKHLSEGEFQSYKNASTSKPFSEFAKFCQDLRGYKLLFHDELIDKWEAFYICKKADMILDGMTKIVAIEK